MKIQLGACILIFCGLCSINSLAQTPPQAAIATAHPLATQAGKKIMLQGGNAFDAAVAVTAALAVVEPYSSGLGGGGFWLLRDASHNKILMIDGRETAPAKADRDMYLDKNGHYITGSSVDGALAAGIPGSVAAMVYLSRRFGVLPLKQVLQPAIQYAEQGFSVTEHYRQMAAFRLSLLQSQPESAQIFLHHNQVPEIGYLIIQKDLSNTLKQIAEQGRAGFYQGVTASRLVNAVNAADGIWQLKDLKNYQIKRRQPIVFQYQNMKISSVAPPSSGGIALATILQILQNYELNILDEASRTHLIVEAMRRAYRDRAEYLGDSDFIRVPVQRLTSSEYAHELAKSIQLNKATPSVDLPAITHRSEGQDTTHFSVLDTQGNMVSATMSINYPFGSGVTAKGTGVLLNDEMDDFSALPGTPNVYGLVGAQANAIAPGKRPLSSMSPTIVETRQGFSLLGTPGGSRIISMVLLGILTMEQTPATEQWVSRPRFHHQYLPDKIFYEPRALSSDVISKLEQMGHQTEQLDGTYGNMQAVSWNFNKGVQAASDPRVEGEAIVFKVPKKLY